MIKLDKSPCTVVIYCTECPHWRALRFSVAEAHDCAIAHEKLTHPGDTKAQIAAAVFRSRRPVILEM